jgi:hypothetical protein
MSRYTNWEKTQLLVEPDGSERLFHRRLLPWWFKDGVRQYRATQDDDFKQMHADGYQCHSVWTLVEDTTNG